MHRLRAALLLTLVVAGCSSTGGGPGALPGATVPPAPTTSAPPDAAVRAEVEAAYLRSWDVYARALRTLSTDGLEESFSGDALASTIAEIGRLRAANTPVQMTVKHHIELSKITGDLAVVTDRYQNHAVLLDASSGLPAEPDPNNEITFSYSLKRIGPAWRITDIRRLYVPPSSPPQ